MTLWDAVPTSCCCVRAHCPRKMSLLVLTLAVAPSPDPGEGAAGFR